MSTIILDHKQMALKLEGAALVIHIGAQRQQSIPLKFITRIVVYGEASVSTATLAKITECGIAILLMAKRKQTRQAYIIGPMHNDARIRLGQYQLFHNTDKITQHAKRLILGKTQAQIKNVQKFITLRSDLRRTLFHAEKQLNKTEFKIDQAETTNQLLGLEGNAASTYLTAYKALFPESLGFNRRTRRPPTDPVNACLSLAYTLMHFEAVRMLNQAGLDPFIGFYHQPDHGRESLACDIIEPLRPKIELFAYQLFRDRQLNKDHFSKTESGCRMGKTARSIFYPEFEQFAQAPRRYLRIQAYKMAKECRSANQ